MSASPTKGAPDKLASDTGRLCSMLDLDKLEKVRQRGGKTIARCPACAESDADGKGEHLSIFKGGRFACVQFPGADGKEHRKRIFELTGIPVEKPSRLSPKQRSGNGATWATLDAAIATFEHSLSMKATRRDSYHDREGKEHLVVVRFDGPGGKQFRPFHRSGEAWIAKDPPGELPLFRLPALIERQSERVFVVEGEKCACELEKLGLLVATSAHGAKSGRKSDWGSLAGRDVVILPDNDPEGITYAATVAKILTQLSPPARVRVVELPGLPPKGDAVEWLEARDNHESAGIVAELDALIANALPVSQKPSGAGNGDSVTPESFESVAGWFEKRFPQLPAQFGPAVLEEPDANERLIVRDICQPFLAATLGERGNPNTPTVFIPTENRFWTYLPEEGVFIHQRDADLLLKLSQLLLEASRACDGAVTKRLAFQFRDSSQLTGIVRHAQGILAKPHNYFENGLTDFIPCQNGMLRLSDRKLLPFSPTYRRRNKLSVPYDASAKCPLFLDTLMRPALDADELDLLQRWCGLALVGENLAQRILLLIGTPGGGKGTLVRVIRGIIGGGNMGCLRTHLLGERFEIGRFLGKSLLYGADVPDDFLNHRAASILKSLTGADPITLEFKNSNESPEILCRFNVLVTCNSRLTVHLEGDTGAWRRRLAIVEYRKPKAETDIADLSDRILACEAPGVLNWMLEGLERLRADGWQLNLTASQQRTVDDLLLESEGHTVFLRESLERDNGAQLTVADCFNGYVEFCTGRGWRALSRNKFGAAIGDAIVHEFGITARHDVPDSAGKPQRGWKGIRLK